MSPRFVLVRENVPCVAGVINRPLKADCTDFNFESPGTQLVAMATLSLRGVCGLFGGKLQKLANFNMISPSNQQYRFRFGINT